MQTDLDCIPCFVSQALAAARLATDDTDIHEKVVRGVMEAVGEVDLRMPPPIMGRFIHRRIRELTSIGDPYQDIKKQFNQVAMDLYPALKRRITTSMHPAETAVRLAAAGNIIDLGVNHRLDDDILCRSIEDAMDAPLFGGLDHFSDAVDAARSILYIGDNAGEIVFDRLLIEQLPYEKITFCVRGYPVINDATMEDADEVGMSDLVEVIDNGDDTPGTYLERCSELFRHYFDGADLIIAKGQGNYETLSDRNRPIFFLLKAKCPVIARHIGCAQGRHVVLGHLPKLD